MTLRYAAFRVAVATALAVATVFALIGFFAPEVYNISFDTGRRIVTVSRG